jgi:hypothetical protein
MVFSKNRMKSVGFRPQQIIDAVWRPPGLPPHPRPHHLGRPQRSPFPYFHTPGDSRVFVGDENLFVTNHGIFSWFFHGDIGPDIFWENHLSMGLQLWRIQPHKLWYNPKHYDDTFTRITGTAPPSSLWQSSTLPLEMAMGMIGKSPRKWNYQSISVCKSGNCLKIQWFVSIFIIISPSKWLPFYSIPPFFSQTRLDHCNLDKWLTCKDYPNFSDFWTLIVLLQSNVFDVYRGWFLGMGCDRWTWFDIDP